MAAADQTALNHTHPQGRGASRALQSALANFSIAVLAEYLPSSRLGCSLWRLPPNYESRCGYDGQLEKTHLLIVLSGFGGEEDSPLVMQPDLEKYRSDIEEFDLTREQQDELIHNLWQIMEAFADQAFGIHSTQLALPTPAKHDCSGTVRPVGCSCAGLRRDFTRERERNTKQKE